MTNISKVKIDTTDYKIAYTELSRFIGRLNANNANFLINELLTESETVMIVKRFAAILMLHNNYSAYRVSHTLSISLSTSERLQENYNNGDYNGLVSCIKKKDTNRFLLLIQDLIMAQVSPRARARLLNRVV